jgi:MFS family permease
VSGASLGAAVGALTAGPLTDRFGRKSLLIVDAAIYAVGAILSAVTPNAAVLLAARTLIGLAIGADSAIATAYIAEYAPGRALIIVCVFFVFQQITGINVPLYYGPHLLGPLFQAGGSKVATTIAGVEVTAIMTAVNVAATYLGFRYIDKIGRRKMSMAGYTGMAASAVIAAIGLGFLGGTGRIVLVMVGLDIFIACFALGVGGTGWLIQGESFPTAVRGQAAAIAACVDWLANFALIEAFPNLQSAIGLGWVLIVFAVLCALAITFVFLFLPETKGHSIEEITELFDKPARQAVAASLAPADESADSAPAPTTPAGWSVSAGRGATGGPPGTSESGKGGNPG